MSTASSTSDKRQETRDLPSLPESAVARWLLIAGVLAASGLVFAAYLRPNMVFDLANMVFCG